MMSVPKGINFQVTEHFNTLEFRCRCCGRLLLDEHLVVALEELRKKAGAPIYVTSGYRCPKHNAAVGGSKRSQHMLGKAADVMCKAGDLYPLALAVDAFTGIGLYDIFTHVDIRDGRRVTF